MSLFGTLGADYTDAPIDPLTGMPMPSPQLEPPKYSLSDIYRAGTAGMPGMEAYQEANPEKVFGAYDKQQQQQAAFNALPDLGATGQAPTPWIAPDSNLRKDPLTGETVSLNQQVAGDKELAKMVVPTTPLDAGLMIAGGPVGGKLLRVGALAAGAALNPDDAEASFGTRLSKTADLAKLRIAELMKRRGAAADQIWRETGWFEDAGKNWLYEIPDTNARYLGTPARLDRELVARQQFALANPDVHSSAFGLDARSGTRVQGANYQTGPRYPAETRDAYRKADEIIAREPPATFGEVVDHPALYAAEPDIAKMTVEPMTGGSPSHMGSYYTRMGPNDPGLIRYRHVEKEGVDTARGPTLDVLLHEGTHGVQQIHGLPSGANPDNWKHSKAMTKLYNEVMDRATTPMTTMDYAKQFYGGDIQQVSEKEYLGYVRDLKAKRNDPLFQRQIQQITMNEAYRRSAGENMANIPAIRKDYTASQRAGIIPTQNYKFPAEQQIVTKQPALNVGPVNREQPPLLSERGAPQMSIADEYFDEPSAIKRLIQQGVVRGPTSPVPQQGLWTHAVNDPYPAHILNAPQRIFRPGIYDDPRAIAAAANAKVAPEHPALKELFGVTRDDLYGISQQGRRQGNVEPKFFMPQNPGTNYAAANIQTPANEQRLVDILGEALKHPDLTKGMVPWYVQDPLFWQMEKLVGREQAIKDFTRLNSVVPPFSASSDVLTEINRGTAANMYAKRSQAWREAGGTGPDPYEDYHRYVGIREKDRPNARGFPEDLKDVKGHAYHEIQSDPVRRWLATGEHGYGDDTVKIPGYILASGVPETGFQTRWAVPDAHIARGSGMSDVRTTANPGDYMGGSEYRTFAPWYREKIAKQVGLEAVPAQALQWGTLAPATGVETPIGAGKLELLAQSIWERAQKLGIDPKALRDAVLKGDAHALWLLGLPAVGAGAAKMGIAADTYHQ